MCNRRHLVFTFSDGTQDAADQVETCGRGLCRHPNVETIHRHVPYPSSSEAARVAMARDIGAVPTYLSAHLPPSPRQSKSPSSRRDSTGGGIFLNGTDLMLDFEVPNRRHRDGDAHHKSHHHSHSHEHRRSGRHHDSDRSKRSSAYVVVEQDGRDNTPPPAALTVAVEGTTPPRQSGRYFREHANNAQGYVIVDDEDERRRQRRAQRRASISLHAHESAELWASTLAAAAAEPAPIPPPRPRRSSTVIHSSDVSGHSAASSRHSDKDKPQHIQWADGVRQKVERQNAQIAGRPRGASDAAAHPPAPLKGILKKPGMEKKDKKERAPSFSSSSSSVRAAAAAAAAAADKEEDMYALRRSMERMDVGGGGRERMVPRSSDLEDQLDRLRGRLSGGDGSRRKVWVGGRYEYL